jgi:hypothetical protein
VAKSTPGLWQAEWQCGSCGTIVTTSKRLPAGDTSSRPAAYSQKRCHAVYMGRPKNICGWPMSFVWIYVPPGGRGS